MTKRCMQIYADRDIIVAGYKGYQSESYFLWEFPKNVIKRILKADDPFKQYSTYLYRIKVYRRDHVRRHLKKVKEWITDRINEGYSLKFFMV